MYGNICNYTERRFTRRIFKLSGPILNTLLTFGAFLMYLGGIISGFEGRFHFGESTMANLCLVTTIDFLKHR